MITFYLYFEVFKYHKAFKCGSDCFKGCFTVKNEYFIDSEIMLITSLRPWELFLLAVI